jgi:2-oxo-4-hydroxy-4-carboxy--5-ureidoimidazoline (OHCU) decarboxylase
VVALDDRSTFDTEVGPLFEGAPRFLARLAAARPFASPEAMFAQARAIAKSMPEAEQVELIDAHPRLGAPPETISAHSFREQGYERGGSGDGSVSDAATTGGLDLATELERLNDSYEARFGFRYCVFVAGRSRTELLPGMAAALEADREAEKARALDSVIDIAEDRYLRSTGGAAR